LIVRQSADEVRGYLDTNPHLFMPAAKQGRRNETNRKHS
jgi:hypothetical protein